MEKKIILENLMRIEALGIGFWNRESNNKIGIFFRNDYEGAWLNARAAENFFSKILVEECTPDRLSGHLRIAIKGFYKKRR